MWIHVNSFEITWIHMNSCKFVWHSYELMWNSCEIHMDSHTFIWIRAKFIWIYKLIQFLAPSNVRLYAFGVPSGLLGSSGAFCWLHFGCIVSHFGYTLVTLCYTLVTFWLLCGGGVVTLVGTRVVGGGVLSLGQCGYESRCWGGSWIRLWIKCLSYSQGGGWGVLSLGRSGYASEWWVGGGGGGSWADSARNQMLM